MIRSAGILMSLFLAIGCATDLPTSLPMEEDMLDGEVVGEDPDDFPLLEIEVNWRQWVCCWDTCGKGNRLHGIKKSNQSKYLDCRCKDGRIFELRKKDERFSYDDTGSPYKAISKK